MSRWKIYSKDGSVLHESIEKYDGKGRVVEQDTLEYSGKWMGDCFITVSFKSAYPIDFQIGDYIIYRGEKFTINYDPTVVKKSSRGTYGEGFVYDSVKFNALSNELTDVKFHDWVLSDNHVHYSSLPNFSFYAKDMNDLADRLQACMDRWCKDNGFAKEDYWIFYTPGSAGDTNPYDRTITRAKDISTDETFIANVLSRWKSIYGDGGTLVERADELIDKNVQINNQTVWQGMALFKSDFGLNFIIRGREVIVGAAGVVASHIFKYGKGNGLYEVEKQADTDQKVVTRLHAYGSSDNLPTRYYAELDMKVFANVTSVEKGKDFFRIGLDMDYKPGMFTQKMSKYGDDIFAIKIELEGTEIKARIEGHDDNNKAKIYSEYLANSTDPDDNTDKSVYDIFYNAVDTGKKIYITGGVNKDLAPSGHIDYAANHLPDNMAINNLMLPGFPKYALSDLCKSEYDEKGDSTHYYIRKNKESSDWVLFHSEAGNHVVRFSSDKYDPYIVSANADKLGYKDDDIFCTEENDDNGLKKVYPSVEEITEAEAGVSTDDKTYINTIVSADIIKDNGVYPKKTGTSVPGFQVVIKNLGFDLQDAIAAAGGESCKLSMKDGHCGGRDFDVPSVAPNSDGTWTLNCKRSPDSSLDLYYPYSYNMSIGGSASADEAYQIRKGDHFVLTGIAMEATNYVWAASVKLLRKAIHWLCKNDYSRYTYTPKIDEIYMARQDQEAQKSEGKVKSLHDTIKEGDLLWFQDDDLLLDGKVYIDQLVIKENGNNGIPTYDVTLRNEVQVGTIQRIQNKVDSIANDVKSGNVGGAMSPSSVEDIVNAVGDNKYLRKDKDDTTKHKLTMGEAEVTGEAVIKDRAKSDNFDNHVGFPFGTGWAAIKDDGSESHASMLEVDKLFVRMKAYFAELEIRKISYLGGNYVFSSAGGKIYYVEWLDANGKILDKTEANKDLVKRFRCYLYSDDGTTQTMNWFKEDDQVRCQNFGDLSKNAKAANGVITATDYTTHYWWRRVNAVGNGAIAAKGDKRTYQYIEFLNDPGQYGADSDFPEIGDAMVQFGNWTTASRQGVIMIVVTGDDAPAIIEWQDVGANGKHFTMPEKEYTRLSPRGEGNIIRGKFISVSGTATDRTGQPLDEQINALVDQLNDIKNQADKKFDIWFNGGEPHPNSATDTETNAPASDWKTDAEKGLHAQDLYYDTDKAPASKGGRAWRWMAHNTGSAVSYYWDAVTDKDTTDALDKAIDLQNQVDNIASDGIISRGSEKSQLLIEWNKALANFQKYSTLADAKHYALTSQTEWKNYSTAFFDLAKMLNGGDSITDVNSETPSWLSTDLNKDTAVNADSYRKAWKDYNDAFAAFLELLSKTTKDLVDNAQTTADSKVQTFVRDSTTPPYPPFKAGDFWIQTDKDNNVMVCKKDKSAGDNQYSVGEYWADLSDIYGNTPDMRTILATLADKVWTLAGESYLEQHSNSYIDVYIGSQPTSSVYDSDISYYNGVLYVRKDSSWTKIENSGYENTFVTVMAMLGAIKIRVFNYSTPPSPKPYDLALTQISIQDPVDGQVTKGNYEIMMYNEKGVWEVLRTCTLGILKNYGDHIVGLVAGSEKTLSERIDSLSEIYATEDSVNILNQKFTFDEEGNITNFQKSGLLTTADGNLLYALSQSSTVNMLMGTATGSGWTHEKSCTESRYSFDGYTREFTIINYLPAYKSGYNNTSSSKAYSTLASSWLRVTPGKVYVLSFKPIVGEKVNFMVGLKYGKTGPNGDFYEYYNWKHKSSSHKEKAMEVMVPTKDNDGRYFIVFTAKSGYDYLQVLFINEASGDNYEVSTSSSNSSKTIYDSWPYSDTNQHTVSNTETVSKDGAEKTTVTVIHRYAGSTTQYVQITTTKIETVKPIYLWVKEPQLEVAARTKIADIEPSPYKESQNAIESYIKQTADSIELRASKIIFKGETVINGKFIVDNDGNVTLNYLTANNATINGVINAESGKIGGWQIDGVSLKSNGQGAAINIEQDGYNFARFGDIGDKSFLSVRMDKDTSKQGHWDCAASFNTYGSNGTALSLMAKSGGYALESYGRANLCSRNAESVMINHLALKTDRNTDSFDKGGAKIVFGKGGVSIENESFSPTVIITSKSYTNISLPANPNKGDLRIVVQGSSDKVTITDPNGHWFQHGNETARSSVNSDTNGQWTFFLYDGFYWQVVYCNGRPW